MGQPPSQPKRDCFKNKTSQHLTHCFFRVQAQFFKDITLFFSALGHIAHRWDDRRSFCLFHVSAENCVFSLWCICIPVFLILRTSEPDERRCFCLFRVFVSFVRAENKLRPCGSVCFARKAWLGINLQNRLIKEGPLEEVVKKGRVQKKIVHLILTES